MANERRIGISPAIPRQSTREVLRATILDSSLKLESDPCAEDQLANTINTVITPSLTESREKGNEPRFYLFTQEDPKNVARFVTKLLLEGTVERSTIETMTVIKTGGKVYMNLQDYFTGLKLVEIPDGMAPYNYEQPLRFVQDPPKVAA